MCPTPQTTGATTRMSSTRVKRTEGVVEAVATPLEDLLVVEVEVPQEMEAATHREDLLGSAAVVEVPEAPEEMEVVTPPEDLLASVEAVEVPGEVEAASEVVVMEVALEEVAAVAQEVTRPVDLQVSEVETVAVVVSGVETVAAEETVVDSTATLQEDQEMAVHQVLTCLLHESDEEKVTQ